MTDESISARVPESVSDDITRLTDSTGLSRSEVIRRLIDNGLRAQKYYDEFQIDA
jgi:Arc/MetJ-type ribon-helix-helix transcriptional regulator